MSDRDPILSRTRGLREGFAQLVRHMDRDELEQAVRAARALSDEIDAILRLIQSTLIADLKANRLRTLNDDLAVLEGLEKTPPTPATPAEISRLAAHLSGHVRSVDALARAVYAPMSNPVLALVRRHGLKAAAALAAALVLFGVIGYARGERAKRQGLEGRYSVGVDFERVERIRIDKAIDFPVSRTGPFADWRREGYSVRWTGFLYVPSPGTWKIATRSDDGVKVTLGGKVIISNWTSHDATFDRAELRLAAGYYPIGIDYFQGRGSACMQLMWSPTADKDPVVIPARNLVTSSRYLKSGVPVIQTLPDNALLVTPTRS